MSARFVGDPAYRSTFVDRFDGLTPENEMKMEELRPTESTWNWGPADELVDLATANGKAVRGHTLIWYSQLPDWIRRRAWTRDALREQLRTHVAAVVGRYRGRVGAWDVVNEPVADHGGMRPSVWQDTIGTTYIDDAFRAARAADPAATLWLNDYYLEWDADKAATHLQLVKDLLRRGVPIDGVGFQLHADSEGHAPSQATVSALLDRYARLGLKVAVTEMDVNTEYTRGSDATKDAKAAGVFGAVATACRLQPACSEFSVWGVSDAQSWIGAWKRPLLFDADYRAKPAWDAVTAQLRP